MNTIIVDDVELTVEDLQTAADMLKSVPILSEYERELLKQFPREAPPVPYDSREDHPQLDPEPQYSLEPYPMIVIPLMKPSEHTKHLRTYNSLPEAIKRGRELAKLRGLRIHRVFQTARAYVVHAYKPLGVGGGIR